MKSIPKARIVAFTKLSQANLLIYAQNVVTQMTGNARYESYSGEVTRLAEATQAYDTALTAMRSGDITTTIDKNDKKNSLLNEMRHIAGQLTLNASGDATFITEAGFDLHRDPVEYRGELPVPIIQSVQSTGQRGELAFVLASNTFEQGANQVAIEYSLDDGQAWQNGTYKTTIRFTLYNLPASLNMQVRVKLLGTKGRSSGYSNVEICGVL